MMMVRSPPMKFIQKYPVAKRIVKPSAVIDNCTSSDPRASSYGMNDRY
jgi:hypothetical protein